ncbi:unnamed protein product [Cyclocybe aegerita]|uniref:ABC transporter domain-containing protein n=1 Tax=Cyclocybe aegerita TaxID=1973307 RepID=A0A8S0W6Z8_CYCAE|nr:unnamed protein product [Cyclocybe aegerita]
MRIPYQLTGAVAQERATSLTSHMQAMSALDSARTLAWHLSTSLLYFPTWLILAGIWKSLLFTQTSVGLLILIHLITGFGLASTSLFISVPFSKSPQLAAVIATGLSIAVGVAPMMLYDIGTFIPGVLSFFPSMFYLFSLKALSGFEIEGRAPKLSEPDPNHGLALQPMIIGALIGVFVWPCLAIYCERIKYRISNPSNSGLFTKKIIVADTLQPGIALSLRNVRKVYNTSAFRRKSKDVVAIANLTLDVPSYGMFVLLGPNGAGKSTTLSVIGGLERASSGSVVYEGNASRPTHGMLGIVPQKNVLSRTILLADSTRLECNIRTRALNSCFVIATCSPRCMLRQAHFREVRSGSFSLQLALLAARKFSSSMNTLTKYRGERTILFTTHFLDEADFLADQIAVLAAPGKLIVADTPVRLKSTMGEGYSVAIKFTTNIQ